MVVGKDVVQMEIVPINPQVGKWYYISSMNYTCREVECLAINHEAVIVKDSSWQYPLAVSCSDLVAEVPLKESILKRLIKTFFTTK